MFLFLVHFISYSVLLLRPFCQDQTVHRSVKPHILSAFGDVALAVGTEFRKYAEPVLVTLEQAAASPVDKVTALLVCTRISGPLF